MATGTGILRVLRGKVGDLVYRTVNGKQVAARYNPQVRNPRTTAQMEQRTKWPNLVNMYKQLQPYMKDCFETRKAGQSDYNRFMSINLMSRPVYITKQEAALGSVVVGAYMITQGSLPSIQVTKTASTIYSNISLGSLQIDENTTIATFAQAVVENNDGFQYGDQISYFSCLQLTDSIDGHPYARIQAYKINLDLSSNEKLWDVGSSYGFSTTSGFLGAGDEVGEGGFAWVHSRKNSNGKTKVSSQRLITNNPLLNEYESTVNKTASMQSYGVGSSIFIKPDGTSSGAGTTGATVPPSVNSCEINGSAFNAQSDPLLLTAATTIELSGNNMDNVTKVELLVGSTNSTIGSTKVEADISSQTKTSLTASATTTAGNYLWGLYLNDVQQIAIQEPEGDDETLG